MQFKKPRFWDYKKPNIFSYLLLPIALLIQILVRLKKKSKFKNKKIKTICIGNIYIGGTGKTSLCIKINEILNKRKIKSCFVKKLYLGQFDEQKLLKKHGKLFLSKERSESINQAAEENFEFAVLDDGLQDYSTNYDFELVCFNNINWIGNGFTIPAGPLRESINNLKKYKHIFLNGNLENLEILKKEILQINSEINIYTGKYIPLNIDQFNKEDRYLVFSGIGNHGTFVSMIKNYGLNILKDIEFPDHYNYTIDEINQILNEAKKMSCKIITTEKDYLRLKKINNNEIQFIKSDLQITNEEKLIENILKKNETN
tara:strand:- start:1040 stop:1984 length:945 start_codon:yes stop_codon:yes gene_type:complete